MCLLNFIYSQLKDEYKNIQNIEELKNFTEKQKNLLVALVAKSYYQGIKIGSGIGLFIDDKKN